MWHRLFKYLGFFTVGITKNGKSHQCLYLKLKRFPNLLVYRWSDERNRKVKYIGTNSA